jgi:hypothetical protein
MPFFATGPTSKPEPEPEATSDLGERGTRSETTTDGNDDTRRQELQERQVRLTAQRILAEHLRDDRTPDQRSAGPPGPRFWLGISLDLTGATLIDFSFHRVVAADARFDGATFIGIARFYEAIFTGLAWFRGATFADEASFGHRPAGRGNWVESRVRTRAITNF